MPFITFIYKIANEKYFGKYDTGRMSDDHSGLDKEVLSHLYRGLIQHRKNQGITEVLRKKDIKIAVLSFSDDKWVPTYSSDDEYQCFDFYCVDYDYGRDYTIYINGNKLEKIEERWPNEDTESVDNCSSNASDDATSSEDK